MINLIVAPLSESELGEDYCKRIVAYLKSEKKEYAVYFSPKLEDLKKNVSELTSQGETEFIVIGNDVVLHNFLNAAKDVSKINIGLVRAGKYDDFARFLGIAPNPIQAVKDILENNVQKVDYISLNGIIVANNILIGASAEIYELYSQSRIKTPLKLHNLRNKYGRSFSGTELVMDIKGEEKQTKNIYEMSICNCGMSKRLIVSPLANPIDGLINVNYAEVGTITERGKYLKQLGKGEGIYLDYTQQKWLTGLKLSPTEGEIKALVDGSIMKFDNINISVVKKGLNIYKAK